VASTGDVFSLTLQRYCEQLLSGRAAVSARDVAILTRLQREFRRDAERDRLAVAQLTLTARRLVARLAHRAWGWPTPDEAVRSVEALQRIAPGRTDLLAEAAGVMLGAAEGTVDESRACAAAELCRAAGADPALIPRWTEEGRRRAQAVFDRQAARVAPGAAGRAAGLTAGQPQYSPRPDGSSSVATSGMPRSRSGREPGTAAKRNEGVTPWFRHRRYRSRDAATPPAAGRLSGRPPAVRPATVPGAAARPPAVSGSA
jgi:hypothetical protein